MFCLTFFNSLNKFVNIVNSVIIFPFSFLRKWFVYNKMSIILVVLIYYSGLNMHYYTLFIVRNYIVYVCFYYFKLYGHILDRPEFTYLGDVIYLLGGFWSMALFWLPFLGDFVLTIACLFFDTCPHSDMLRLDTECNSGLVGTVELFEFEAQSSEPVKLLSVPEDFSSRSDISKLEWLFRLKITTTPEEYNEFVKQNFFGKDFDLHFLERTINTHIYTKSKGVDSLLTFIPHNQRAGLKGQIKRFNFLCIQLGLFDYVAVCDRTEENTELIDKCWVHLGNLEAQTFLTIDIGAIVISLIKDKISCLKRKIDEIIPVFLKELLDKFLTLVGQVYDFLSLALDSVVNFCTKMFDKLRNVFDEDARVMEDYKDDIYMILALVFFLAICGIGFLSFEIVKRFMQRGSTINVNVAVKYEAQAFVPDNINGLVTLFTTFAAFGLNFSTGDVKSLRGMLEMVNKSMAWGNLGKNMAIAALALVPPFWIFRFSKMIGSSDPVKTRLSDWTNDTLALVAVKEVPEIINSDMFCEKVDSNIKEATTLLALSKEHPENEKLVPRVLNMINKSISLFRQANTIRFSKIERRVPFAIHLAALPGVGKNLIHYRLLREVTGVPTEQFYEVPLGNKHWDGSNDCSAIIYDEFLVGDEEIIKQTAMQYLHLISNSKFIPPQADLSNKGRQVRPKIVLTMSNDLYPAARQAGLRNYKEEAQWRRRNFVIEMRCVKEYFLQHPSDRVKAAVKGGKFSNKIPLIDMSKEDISKVAWARFRFVPNLVTPLDNNDFVSQSSDWLTFHEIIPLLKDAYKEHLEVATKIEDSLDIEYDELTAEKAWNRIQAAMFGAPVDVTGLVSGDFSAQAKDISDVSSVSSVSSGTRKKRRGRKPKFAPKPINMMQLLSATTLGGNETKCVEEVTQAVDSIYLTENTSESRSNAVEAIITSIEEAKEVILEEQRKSALEDEILRCKDNLDGFLFRGLKERFDTLPAKMTSFWNNSYVKIGVSMSSFMGVLWALYKIQSGTTEELTFEANSEKPMTTKVVAPKAIKVRRVKTKCFGCRAGIVHRCSHQKNKDIETKVEAQSSSGSSCILKIIVGDCMFENTVVMLGGKKFLVHTHAFTHPEILEHDPDDITLLISIYGVTYRFSDYDLVVLENKDISILVIEDNSIPNQKDQLYKFITGPDLNNLMFATVNGDMEGVMDDHPLKFSGDSVEYAFKSGRIKINTIAFYDNVNCQRGDCGKPLILNCPLIPALHGKIAGIHVAGNSNTHHGLTSVITKNQITTALETALEGQASEPVLMDKLPVLEGDNVYDLQLAPRNLQVYVPSRSVLKPSYLNLDEECYLTTKKRPAIMSEFDFRAKGVDPKANFIRLLSKSNLTGPSKEDLSEIFSAIEGRLKETLFWPVKRRLTINEAVGGIPGVLASVKTITSCGYPLIYSRKGKGKTDHMWFDELGKAVWTDEFEEMVMAKVHEMETYDDGEIDHIFIGYLKDELVSEKKITEVNTRVIFCNDMITLVACRIVFGALLCAFHNSFPVSDYAIGMNANSYDMDILFHKHNRRVGRYMAGDYSNFDRTFIHSIRDESYFLLGRLLGVPKPCVRFLLNHECYSRCMLGPYIFRVRNNNCSGGIFTTLVNCIQNDFYLRWAFKYIFPYEIYDNKVVSVILGDDHHTSFCDTLEVNPREFQKFFESKGLTYGSAFKGQELEDHLVNFEDTIFLGCMPICFKDRYTGALKKESIEGALTYTRDKHLTFLQTVHQEVEASSQWGPDYYRYLTSEINSSNLRHGKLIIKFEPWETMFRIQASRGALIKRYDLLSHLNYRLNIPMQLLPFEATETKIIMPITNKIQSYNGFNAAYPKKHKRSESLCLDDIPFEAQGNISSTNINYSYDNITGDIPTQQTIAVKNKPNNQLKAKASLPMDNPPMSGGHVPIAPQFSSLSKSIGVEPTVSLQFDQAMMFREPATTCEVDHMGIESICARRGNDIRVDWTDTDAVGKVLVTIPLNSILTTNPTIGANSNISPNIMLLNQFQFWRADIVFDIFVPKTMFHSGKLLVTLAYGAPSIASNEINRFLNYELDFSGTNMWHEIVVPWQAATEYLRVFEGAGAPDRIQDYSLGIMSISVLNELTANSSVSAAVGLHIFPRFKNVHVYEMKARPWMQMDSFTHYSGPEIFSGLPSDFEAQSNDPITLQDSNSSTHGLTTLDTRLQETTNTPITSDNQVSNSLSEPFYDFKYALETRIKRGTVTWSSTDVGGAVLKTIQVPWGIIDNSATATIQDMAFNNYTYFYTDVELTFQVNAPPTAYGAIWIYFVPLTSDLTVERNGSWVYGLDGVWLIPNGDTTATLRVPFKFYRNAMNTYAGGTLAVESLGTVFVKILEPLTSNAGITASVTWFSSFKNSYFTIVRPRVLADSEETQKRLKEDKIRYIEQELQQLTNGVVDGQKRHLELSDELKNIKLEAQSSDPVVQNDDDPRVDELEQKVFTRLAKSQPERTSRRVMGRKFEFTQTSLVDIMRRHTRYDLSVFNFGGLGWNPTIYKNSSSTDVDTAARTVVAPVFPLHRFATFFKGWSGHLKYRILVPKGGWCRVTYVSAGSYAKRPGSTPELSTCMGDAEGGKDNAVLATWSVADTKIVQRERFQDDKATEVCFPMTAGADSNTNQWLDFSIPFNTHLNFLPTNPYSDDFASSATGDQVHRNNLSNGYIIIKYGNDNANGVGDIQFYQAVGDDFCLHMYKPYFGNYIGPIVYQSGVNPYTMSGKTVAYYGNYMGAAVTEF